MFLKISRTLLSFQEKLLLNLFTRVGVGVVWKSMRDSFKKHLFSCLKRNFPFRHTFLSFNLQKVTFNWLLTNVGVGDCNWLLTRVGVGDCNWLLTKVGVDVCNWLLTKVGVDDVCNWLLTKVGVEDVCNWLLTKVGVADGRCCCKISCMVTNAILLFFFT